MMKNINRRTLIHSSVLLSLSMYGSLTRSQNTTQKFALLIGNYDYIKGFPVLKNAKGDLGLIDEKLKKLGFQVSRHDNLTTDQIYKAVEAYKATLPPSATSFIFYAGHGMEINGVNYIIPTDAPFDADQITLTSKFSYPLKRLMETIASSKAIVSIVVLDACRDNRFQKTKPQQQTRGGSLAEQYAPRGTLLAYSTSPGLLASDGANQKHSPYAQALADTMLKPGLTLEDIFTTVGVVVRGATRDEQIPWIHSTLTEKYYLIPPNGVKVIPGTALSNNGSGLKNGRGGDANGSNNELWFRNMPDAEWKQLDWDIEQQAKNITPEGLPFLEIKSKKGNVVAQTTLGRYWLGKNNTKALLWLRMAAKAEFPIAQTELGEMYFEGKIINRDLAQSRQLLESAAKANYARAKLDLLHVNTTGNGSVSVENFKDAFNSMLKSTTPLNTHKK